MPRKAFTLIEVLISILLISMSMGSIVATNIRAAKVLRASREVAASSQVLQQRIEMVRDRSWAEVSGAAALARLMRSPTESESELSGAALTETMKVTVPKSSPAGLVETARFFSLHRTEGRVVIDQAEDFSAEPTLLFESGVTWRDQAGAHERVLRTVICRIGLTRSGTVGTVLGRPGARVSASP